MLDLSVIIICKNEERVIEKTLRSVYGWAKEIIVLDSGSTDATVDISNKYTDHVYVTDWPGYGIQKNRAIDKAACKWVLSIDADEVVSENLKSEISSVLATESDYNGYKIPVRLYYFKKYIRSLLKRYTVILFKKEHGRFIESSVHERLEVKGKIRKLRSHIFHDSYDSLFHQLTKLNTYAELWAREQNEKGNSSSLITAFSHSVAMFLKDIIMYGAIFDGWRGVLLSYVHAQYTFNKYAILKSLKSLDS